MHPNKPSVLVSFITCFLGKQPCLLLVFLLLWNRWGQRTGKQGHLPRADHQGRTTTPWQRSQQGPLLIYKTSPWKKLCHSSSEGTESQHNWKRKTHSEFLLLLFKSFLWSFRISLKTCFPGWKQEMPQSASLPRGELKVDRTWVWDPVPQPAVRQRQGWLAGSSN